LVDCLWNTSVCWLLNQWVSIYSAR